MVSTLPVLRCSVFGRDIVVSSRVIYPPRIIIARINLSAWKYQRSGRKRHFLMTFHHQDFKSRLVANQQDGGRPRRWLRPRKGLRHDHRLGTHERWVLRAVMTRQVSLHPRRGYILL